MPGEFSDTGGKYSLDAVTGRNGYLAVTITSTSSGTITTSGAHGLAVGQIIYIAGATTAPAVGQYIVLSVPSSTTLTVGLWTTGATALPSAITTTGTGGTISYYKPARLTYLALLTAAPSDVTTDGAISVTEYGATGYSRQAVYWSAPSIISLLPATQNATAMTFGPFTAGTGATITHAALVSAPTGTTGDMLAWWALDTSRTPATNDAISIAANALTLSVE